MSRIIKFTLIGLVVAYVVFHLATLAYSPLPWFDEVSFIGITNSYIRSGTFFQEPIMINTTGENSMYGPVYFWLQAAIIKLAGLHIFTFRLPNLVFGLIDLWLVARICRHFRFSTLATIMSVAIIALDPSYNQFLHSGRMDNITTFTFLSSFLVFVSIANELTSKSMLRAAAVGGLLATAMLTNPRILFAFTFYGVFFLYEVATLKGRERGYAMVKYIMIGLVCGALYYVWILYKFGSLEFFIYKNYTSNKIMKDHIGIKTYSISLNAATALYVYTFLGLLLLVISGHLKSHAKLVVYSIPVLFGFMLLVGGAVSGRYYALIAPFTTLLFVGATIDLSPLPIAKLPTWGLLCILAAGFLFKASYILSTLPERDPAYNEKQILKYIKPGSTIAGDYEYFYIARHNNCYFQGIRENGPLPKVLDYYNTYKYDYFIFNENNPMRSHFWIKVLQGRYKLLVKYENKPPSRLFSRLIRKMGYHVTENYSCYIYKYDPWGPDKSLPPDEQAFYQKN